MGTRRRCPPPRPRDARSCSSHSPSPSSPAPAAAQAPEPPYSGTIFLDGDIITGSDATAFKRIRAAGRGRREVFDRRVDGYVTLRARLFKARYRDGLRIVVQVNPEIGRRAAARLARRYARVAGRLPRVARSRVRTMTIHRGNEDYRGGNDDLLIHTGRTPLYVREGILEETLVHEAAHTSLDPDRAASPGWRAAQDADGAFISAYARDNPAREDVAESFLPWLAVRHREARIDPEVASTIRSIIPARLAYFDEQGLDLRPLAR